MSNMDDFNKGAALVLQMLYEAFPQEIDFDASKLDPEANKESVKNYWATVEFLEEEGFIRIREAANEAPVFMGARLTSKGLAILNSTPEVLKEKVPLGKRLGIALKDGSKEIIKTLIEKVIEGSVAGVVKAS